MPKTKTALTTLSFYDAYFLSVPADTPREQVITASTALFKRMSAKARPEVAVLGLLAEQSVKDRLWFHFWMSEDTTWVTELVSKGLCKVFPDLWEVALVEALSWQEFTHYKDGKVSLSLGVWPDQAWYTRDKKDVRTYDGREPWVGTLVPESQRHRSIADIGLDAVHCKEPKHSRKLMDKQKAELLYLVRDGKVLKEPEPVPPDADLDEMGLVHVPND